MLPVLHKIMGSILVLVGLVLWPLPIPLGLPLMALGLVLLAPYIPIIQRLVRRIRKKHAGVDTTMVKWRAKCPPVIQKAIDKTSP